MAYITLPSGKRIDTSHISYMSHREHNLDTGGLHRHRTLHMDNNDLIRLDGPDMDALDTALASEGGPGGAGSVIVDNPDTNPVPINTPAGTSLNTSVASTTTAWASQATTDADATLGAAWNKTGFKTTTIVIHNTGANGATVTVEGSVDGTNWDFTILAATNTAAGARQVVRFTDYFTHVRIRIRASVATAQTTVVARAAAIST